MSGEKDLRISHMLRKWYDDNKRDLPWRNTTDPYIIWISEVILQQTRVDQGYDYFNRFVKKYPSVNMLAKANENEVLKLWQGLGYYSRARNLHAAAKMILDEFNGVFPKNYKDILRLRGVGEYTAAAIASFAYNQPYAVVDGNVYRVLSRIFGVDTPINSGQGKKLFAELAQEILDEKNPGQHNQAIMEFGALQCVPVSPNCTVCPASPLCLSYAQNKVGLYPVKEKKQKSRFRYFYYFDIRCGFDMFLRKRVERDIWQNLYELPLMEKNQELSLEELQQQDEFNFLFKNANKIRIKYITQIKHVLSHQTIYASFYLIEVDDISLDDSYLRIKIEEADVYPVSRLVHKYLEQI